MVAHFWNPCIQKGKAGERIHRCPLLHGEFKVSLCDMRPRLRKTKTKPGRNRNSFVCLISAPVVASVALLTSEVVLVRGMSLGRLYNLSVGFSEWEDIRPPCLLSVMLRLTAQGGTDVIASGPKPWTLISLSRIIYALFGDSTKSAHLAKLTKCEFKGGNI